MSEAGYRLPRYVLRLLGVALLVYAGLGLWFNAETLLKRLSPDPSVPYVRPAFYSMSVICMACYVTLAFVGVQFIRLRTGWVRLFVGVVVFEVAYFLVVAALWGVPGVGLSVAAATGIANGGLMFQFMTLFPVWGPLLARWAAKAIEDPESTTRPVYPEPRIARLSDWAWAIVYLVLTFVLSCLLITSAFVLLYPGSMAAAHMAGPAMLFSVAVGLASVWWRRRRRRRVLEQSRSFRLARNLCPRCEYNLTGNVSGVCPECGERIS